MARPLIRLVLLGLALAASHHAPAAVTMQVVTSVHTEAAKGGDAPAADTRETMRLTLANDYTAIDKPDARTIYDFKTRRYFILDKQGKTYVEYSLYSIAGFRAMEFKNRATLDVMLAKLEPQVKPGRLVDREQELSIADGDGSTIDERASASSLEFSSGGQPLASWSKAGASVGATDAARFAQFLRYALAGHPQLLARLAKGGSIPERLSFIITTPVAVRTVGIEVSAVENTQPPAYDLQGYARRRASGNEVDALLDRMAALTPPQLAELRAQHPCDTADDYRADQLLDTMLGRTECVLVTGKPMLAFTPAQLEAMRGDGAVALMFASVSPKNKEEFEAAVKTLVALRAQAPRKVYLLKLFEANNRLRLGQREESLRLFGQVLAANPVLAGAYKDLGDALISGFDMPRGWRSWDIGRAMAPDVPNFSAVNQLEADLAQRHPEFF